MFVEPVEKQLTIKPFLDLEGLESNIQRRILARICRLVPDFLDLDGQNVMTYQLLLKDWHFQALVSDVKLEVLAYLVHQIYFLVRRHRGCGRVEDALNVAREGGNLLLLRCPQIF